MLLSFSVTGFRCFAERATLSLTKPGFDTLTPGKDSSWTDSTLRVASIFGPNASGKTTLVEALWALCSALDLGDRPAFRALYQPSQGVRRTDSAVTYEVDFVSGETRYQYLLEVQSWGISKESLHSYPKGKRRKLFLRSQGSPDREIHFESGPSLKGPTAEVFNLLRAKQPYLGLAAQYGHKDLAPAASALIAGKEVEMVTFRDRQAHSMVKRVVKEMIEAPESQGELINAILQAGDLGLSGIDIRTREVPRRIIDRMRSTRDGDLEDIDEEASRILFDHLVFHHRGEDEESFQLTIGQQSTGTLTWLTISWHALTVLKKGGVLLIDEMDASLHPALARYIVGLFQDPRTNPRGAQLICTTHDVALLGNSPRKILQPENVWFVEKAHNSTSELYSMREFDNRENNNNQRRYTSGVFGAVPNIDDYLLFRFLTQDEDD